MFEFTKLGVLFLISGLVYILLFARRLLPARSVVSSLTRKYHMSSYLTEIKVVTGSKLVGRSCLDVGLSRDYDITVLEIIRNKNRIIDNVRDIALKDGDVLIARGDVGNIMRLREEQGIALLHDVKLSDEELAAEGLSIAEALVTSNSSLLGSTLMEVDFHKHSGAFVVAIRRHGATLRSKIAHIPLEFADTLLLLAPRERLMDLRRSDDVIVLSEVEVALRRGRLWWAIFILIPLIVILAGMGTLDITKGAILATALLLLGRVVTAKEVYRAVDWSVLFLIAAYVPVGQALIDTGTAQFIASGVLSLSRFFPAEYGPQVSISLLYLITTLVTQLISNNAAAIMLVPVSLSIAAGLGIDPRPFLMAICFAASAGFMTPIGYQTNTMVYGPGSYRFFDFTRFGTPLNALLWLIATFLIPYFWPS
jgi:di/tricarboxylate transporter